MEETIVLVITIVSIVAITLIAFVSIVSIVMYFTEKDIRTKFSVKNRYKELKNEVVMEIEAEEDTKVDTKNKISESDPLANK